MCTCNMAHATVVHDFFRTHNDSVDIAYSVSTSFICIFTYPCIYSGMQYHAWWFNYPGGLPHVRLELHTSCVAYRL